MTTLQVFEPGACCSSGACGPDPEKAAFEADLAWAEGQGVTVARHDSSADLGAFAAVPSVKSALEQEGTTALPMVMAGDALVSKGGYPSREDLARALGLAWEAPATLLATAERYLVGPKPEASEGCGCGSGGCC